MGTTPPSEYSLKDVTICNSLYLKCIEYISHVFCVMHHNIIYLIFDLHSFTRTFFQRGRLYNLDHLQLLNLFF